MPPAEARSGALGKHRRHRHGRIGEGSCAVRFGGPCGAAGAITVDGPPVAPSNASASWAVSTRGVCSDMPSCPFAALMPLPDSNFSTPFKCEMSVTARALGRAFHFSPSNERPSSTATNQNFSSGGRTVTRNSRLVPSSFSKALWALRYTDNGSTSPAVALGESFSKTALLMIAIMSGIHSSLHEVCTEHPAVSYLLGSEAFLPFLLMLTLVAAAPSRPSVVVVGLQAVDMPEKKVGAFAELFADELANSTPAIQVTSSQALASLLGLERQRQLVGCTSDASCVAEIVGALAPAAIISGSIVRVGGRVSVSVRVFAGNDGRLLYGQQALVDGEDGALAWLKDEAHRAGEKIVDQFGGATSAAPATRAWGIASTVIAGVGAVSAVVFFLLAASTNQAFLDSANLTDARTVAVTGLTFQTTAWVSVGVAAAGAVAATVLFAASPSAPRVSFFVTPSGGALTFGGSF